MDELEAFLQDKSVDILCLTEHWFTQNEITAFYISDYELSTAYCRSHSRGGGAAILLKSSMPFRDIVQVSALSVENSIEVCSVYLMDLNVYIINLYRPPSGCFNTFMEGIENAINIIGLNKNILLAGDFNVHFGTDARECLELCCLLQSYGFTQLIFEPTRQDRCLDNVFSSFGADMCISKNLETGLSDH